MIQQRTWNLLFGWLTGKQCFIPEGCPPPAVGVAFYGLLVAVVSGAAYYLYRNGIPEWRKLL